MDEVVNILKGQSRSGILTEVLTNGSRKFPWNDRGWSMTIRARCIFTEAERKQKQKSTDRCWWLYYFKSSNVSQWTTCSKDQQQEEKAKLPTIVRGSSTQVAGDLVPGYSIGLAWSSYIGRGDIGCSRREISKSVISWINHSVLFSWKSTKLLKIRECNFDAEK